MAAMRPARAQRSHRAAVPGPDLARGQGLRARQRSYPDADGPGTVHYIIDGLNLIKSSFLKRAEAHSLDAAREALVLLLRDYRRKHPSAHFTVVLDGHGMPAAGGGVSLRYSGDITADDAIRDILAAGRAREPATVVSDDREVQASARVHGARPWGTAAFLAEVASRRPSPARRPREKEEELPFPRLLEIERELRGHYGKKGLDRRPGGEQRGRRPRHD